MKTAGKSRKKPEKKASLIYFAASSSEFCIRAKDVIRLPVAAHLVQEPRDSPDLLSPLFASSQLPYVQGPKLKELLCGEDFQTAVRR